MARKLAVFGSTGSIGLSTLSVVRSCPDLDVEVYALTCDSNWKGLAGQVEEFRPERVVVASPQAAADYEAAGGTEAEIGIGAEGLLDLAADPAVDVVVMALVGAAALEPTIKCVETGKTVALANKECLVMAGRLVMSGAEEHGARIVPVDSEHSAAFQLLRGTEPSSVRRLIITGSGGALRDVPFDELDRITPERALEHPTWNMGTKVTIDSATSVNKAFELIEAHWLFGLPPEALEVWAHPQSQVHALVEFVDGTLTFLASPPDMRAPIQFALSVPEHVPGPVSPLGLEEVSGLTFSEPDPRRFPALPLGYRVIQEKGTLGAVMSAADEVAVDAFLNRRVAFTSIVGVIEDVMAAHDNASEPTLEEILEADRWAREETNRRLG